MTRSEQRKTNVVMKGMKGGEREGGKKRSRDQETKMTKRGNERRGRETNGKKARINVETRKEQETGWKE